MWGLRVSVSSGTGIEEGAKEIVLPLPLAHQLQKFFTKSGRQIHLDHNRTLVASPPQSWHDSLSFGSQRTTVRLTIRV